MTTVCIPEVVNKSLLDFRMAMHKANHAFTCMMYRLSKGSICSECEGAHDQASKTTTNSHLEEGCRDICMCTCYAQQKGAESASESN